MKLEKRIYKKIIVAIVVVLVIYFGTSIFFINRFHPGSTINCINVSGKTVNQAYDEMLDKTKNYELNIKGKNGFNESINGDDINLIYTDNEIIGELKDSQNPFKWIYSVFKSNDYKSSDITSFDNDKLNKQIDNLTCFNINDIEKPKNPILEYENSQYIILKESYGNKINKEKLYQVITDAIESGKTTIDMEEAECYESPRFTSESVEINEAKNTLNKYVSSKIIYNIGDEEEILDGNKIKEFLDVDGDYQVSINEQKVKFYVNTLAEKYNTIGKTRQFKTTLGDDISISGGDYGRKIDTSDELKYIIGIIKDGKTDVRVPKYSQTTFSNTTDDIGHTYVEVNLSGQHLWFYKDGSLIVDGPIVSGNISNGSRTPGGVYKLDYKERNATLKGEGYSTPVSFWMPFNGGIGIHDATWRGSFGGNIYVYGGSHGCVNAPYSLASTIFNNIDEGTPIVCYY